MRSARDRIFRDTFGWGEVAADNIKSLIARRSHNHTTAIQPCDAGDVGCQGANALRILEQNQIIESICLDFNRNHTESPNQLLGNRHRG